MTSIRLHLVFAEYHFLLNNFLQKYQNSKSFSEICIFFFERRNLSSVFKEVTRWPWNWHDNVGAVTTLYSHHIIFNPTCHGDSRDPSQTKSFATFWEIFVQNFDQLLSCKDLDSWENTYSLLKQSGQPIYVQIFHKNRESWGEVINTENVPVKLLVMYL